MEQPTTTNELVLVHEQLIQEEQINLNELPMNIRKRLNGFKMQLGRYNKMPSEKLFKTAQAESIAIADMIQDWLENDAPTEEEIAAQQAEAQKQQQPQQPQQQQPQPQAQQQPQPQPTPPVIDRSALEQIVRDKMVNGKIGINELRNILGKLDTWNGVETIGSLRLRKPMFVNYYIER
jgi:hypothetical protein